MIRSIAASAALSLAVGPGLASAETAAGTIVDAMQSALEPPEKMRASFNLWRDTPRGPQLRWAGEYVREGDRKSFRFEMPDDFRGSEVVVRSVPDALDQITLQMPGVDPGIEMETDLVGRPFLGTDFNYENLGFEAIDYDAHRIIGTDTIDGRPCTRIESIAGEDGAWWYGRIVWCVDDEDRLPRRTEYYNRADRLYRVRLFTRVDTVDGHPTPTAIRMKTLPAGTSTAIDFGDVAYGSPP